MLIEKLRNWLVSFRNYLNPKLGSVCVYESTFPLKLVLDRWKFRPLALVLIFCFFYYFVLFFWNIINGTAFTPEIIEWANSNSILGNYTQSFFKQSYSGQSFKPLIVDNTHTVFSFVLMPVGILIGYYFFKTANYTLTNVYKEEIIVFQEASENEYIENMQKQYRKPIYLIISILFGLLMLFTFIYMSHEASLSNWWGSSKYGFMGYYLALMMSLVAYFAFNYMFILLHTIKVIQNLMSNPIHPRPFHYDKCSGFGILGKLIFFIYFSVGWGGIIIFTVYFLGYFGLENMFIFYFVIIIYTLITPILWLMPARIIVNKLKNEKRLLINRIEKEAQQNFDNLRMQYIDSSFGDDLDERLTKVERAQKILNIVENTPVWPFNIKLIQTIIIGNLIQIIAFVLTILSFIRG